MGRLLPLARRPTSRASPPGCRADVSAARLRSLRSGCPRPLGGKPYFQHFTGETFFQHRLPLHPSSLSRWRVRIGEEGAEWLLTKTVEAGRAAGAVKERS